MRSRLWLRHALETDMKQIESLHNRMQMTRANCVPIVATFCRRVGLIETINRIVPKDGSGRRSEF